MEIDAPGMAVIGQIVELTPIKGADFIVSATAVCGRAGKWKGVVQKTTPLASMAYVFLQDAVLPPGDPRWEFMSKHNWTVRMARFKGAPSECLIIPDPDINLTIGTDITDILGVKKHFKPVPAAMGGDAVGAFPSFIPRTDEDNFQRVPEIVAKMDESTWYAMEKADGTSGTAFTDAVGDLHVCQRNWELREFTASGAQNCYWQVARKYGMDKLAPGVALQFEVVGPGIQKNPMGLETLEARAFNLYDIDEKKHLGRQELEDVCTVLGVPVAPIVMNGGPGRLDDEALRRLAEKTSYANGKPAEGIVIRPMDHGWSFKVISLRYKS